MPRKSKINFLRIQRLLQNPEYSCFDSQKRLRPPTHLVWRALATEYGDIHPKYFYTIVLENRHNVLNRSTSTLTSPSTTSHAELSNSPLTSPNRTSNADLSECSSPASETEEWAFSISIEQKVWRELQTESTYADEKLGIRTYKSLEPRRWSDIFNVKFVDATRLPCCLVFHRARINPTGENYFKFSADCKTCHSNLQGILEEEPKFIDSENVRIECQYKGEFKSCHSTSKRRLIGDRKGKYAKEMLEAKMSASFIRRKEAQDVMSFGEKEPSHLPTGNALRLLKSQETRKTFLSDNPISSLLELKSISPYSEMIRDIGLDNFFVHYWSKTELTCYRLARRNNPFLTISIDATGSIVHKVKFVGGRESRHIFLYEVVVQDRQFDSCYAVSHMLSSRHNANAISFWLREWLKSSNVRLPAAVITDSSLALMHAVCQSFTQYNSLWAYIDICSNLLLNPEVFSSRVNVLPTCFVRNDFNHTMKTFAGWMEIKKASKNTKNFYLRSLALVVGTTAVDTLKEIMKLLFISLLSEENGELCIDAKNRLKHRIAGCPLPTPDMDELEAEVDDPPELSYDEEDSPDGIGLDGVIEAIYKEAVAICASSTNRSEDDNPVCNKSIADKFKKFCKLLPVWSAIMVPIFGYGDVTESSAASEGSFNDVKNRIFMHKNLPIRVDDFIVTHCDAIIGKMNLIRAKANTDDSTIESEPEEDWRGLNKKQKSIRKRPTRNEDTRKSEIQPISHQSNPSFEETSSSPITSNLADTNPVIPIDDTTDLVAINPVTAIKDSTDLVVSNRVTVAKDPTDPVTIVEGTTDVEVTDPVIPIDDTTDLVAINPVTTTEDTPHLAAVDQNTANPVLLNRVSAESIPINKVNAKPVTARMLRKKRKNYPTPDPTILHVKESSKSRKKMIGLMRNGNVIPSTVIL